MIFEKVKPKLAMFSHYTGGVTATARPLLRPNIQVRLSSAKTA